MASRRAAVLARSLSAGLARRQAVCQHSRNPWKEAIRAISTSSPRFQPPPNPATSENPISASPPVPKINKKRTFNVTKADAQPTLSKHHKISFDDKRISLPWEEGKNSTFQHIWLRDHCQCPQCMHPQTKQRTLDTFSLPLNIRPSEVEPKDEGLYVKWHGGHESLYSWEWLHRHSYAPRLEKYPSVQRKLWGKADLEENIPVVKYDDVMKSDNGVAEWTSQIQIYGFCFVDGVPTTPGATKELVERIAHIRHTHYGGFWDFTADLEKKDMAYTNLALPAHTDTTYFTEPCGLQMFHLLEFDGQGGESLLVDGFRAARILREEKPEAFRTLSTIRVPTHASGNEDVSIEPYTPFPVFNHHPVTGELVQVRWNNEDRATMDRWADPEEVEKFYAAIFDWNEVLKRAEGEYREQLVPGRPLIFDNWRVLHGRGSFTGFRRMCGAYVGRDDWQSRLRMTNYGREEILMGL
ncbi:hypothetical protein TWF694_004170 [Orbilia ellipsospora]|uniref:Trimethyllysine dioxygenase n=1 Tax=Orbilia ellipsospora TaxID=2528407 RepID=A0AAV9WXL1_9PEZI